MNAGGATDLQLEVAAQIAESVRRRGLQHGERVTERTLATELGVSRSPVRAALRLLVQSGVMRREGERGGYVIVGDAWATGVPPMPMVESAAERLYMTLARDRLAGRLDGRVTEADLLRRYAVPHAMLVKTLLRLMHEGVVQRGRGRGWTFLPMIDDETSDWASYEFRLAIEPAALRSAAFRVDAARLERSAATHRELIARRLEGISPAELFDINAELHEMLAAFSGNPFFLEAIRQQNRSRRLLELESFHEPERMRASCAEHLRILDAVEAGDREWAASLMIDHLKTSQQSRRARHSRMIPQPSR